MLALALLAFSGTPTAGRLLAGAARRRRARRRVVVLLGLLLRSEEAAARIGLGAAAGSSRSLRRLFGAGPVTGWDRATTKFRGRTVLLLHARWHWITLATLVSHLSLFAVLLLALRFVGVTAAEVGLAEALAVFAFARLLTADPVHPRRAGDHRGRADHRAGRGRRGPRARSRPRC